MRMKHAMVSIVDEARLAMFRQSTDEVRSRLARMMTALEEMMSNKADEVHLMMRRDYTAVLGGSEIPRGESMPKWQRDMRRDVMALIDGSERRFKIVSGVEDEGGEESDGGVKREGAGNDGGKNKLLLQDDDDEPMFRGGGSESDDGIVSNHALKGETKDIKTRDSPRLQERAPSSLSPEPAQVPPQPAQHQDEDANGDAGKLDTIKSDDHAIATRPADPFPVEENRHESFHPKPYDTADDDEDDEDTDDDGISFDSCGAPKGCRSERGVSADRISFDSCGAPKGCRSERGGSVEGWEEENEWERDGGARWRRGFGADGAFDDDDGDWPLTDVSGLTEEEEGDGVVEGGDVEDRKW